MSHMMPASLRIIYPGFKWIPETEVSSLVSMQQLHARLLRGAVFVPHPTPGEVL